MSGSARNHIFEVGPVKLAAHAFSSPTGRRPGGWAHGSGDTDGPGPMEPFSVKGKVTCLRIVGRYASVKYRFEEAHGSLKDYKGGGVQVFIQDNGRPRHGDPVDANGTDLPQKKRDFEASESRCDDPSLRPDYNPVDSGDYVVRDRTP